MELIGSPCAILQRSLDERIAANANYSLRAFARDLGLSPQNLSNVLNGRRGISNKMAVQLAEKLCLTPNERERFCVLANALFSRSKNSRAAAKATLAELSARPELKTLNLEIDLFKTISNWYSFALIELLKVSKNTKVTYLAKRLGIPENEAAIALSRLLRLGLITKVGVRLKVNSDMILADFAVPNEAVMNFHRQVLSKATLALQSQDATERYGSSSVLPMRVKNVKVAKKMIQDFRSKIAAEITDSVGGEELYGLAIQFFKVTK